MESNQPPDTPVLKPACEQFTDALFVAIHDDTYFAAPLGKLMAYGDQRLLTESAAAIGLQYVPKKECVRQLPGSTRPASADLTSLRCSIADITKFVRNSFRCGGIAVGDPVAVDDYAHRAACEYRTHVDHLARSPLQIQIKNVLFSWCGKPTTMLTYMIRAVAPSLTAMGMMIKAKIRTGGGGVGKPSSPSTVVVRTWQTQAPAVGSLSGRSRLLRSYGTTTHMLFQKRLRASLKIVRMPWWCSKVHWQFVVQLWF